jgi:hypothetical protein
MDIRHPEIRVELIGQNGNAFAVMGAVKREMKRAGVDQAEIDVSERKGHRWVEILGCS